MDDLKIAKKYVAKAFRAKGLDHEFELTFNQFKKLMLKKTCAYSGIPFSPMADTWSSRTLDRVDNSIGYVYGNVVACCAGMNQLKSQVENPKLPLDMKTLVKAVCKMSLAVGG